MWRVTECSWHLLNWILVLSTILITFGISVYLFLCFQHFCQQEMNHFHVPYLKNFLKKLISEVESSQVEVLDEFYELYAHYMVSWKVSCWRRKKFTLIHLHMRIPGYFSLLLIDKSYRLIGWESGQRKCKNLQICFFSFSRW